MTLASLGVIRFSVVSGYLLSIVTIVLSMCTRAAYRAGNLGHGWANTPLAENTNGHQGLHGPLVWRKEALGA